MEDITLILLAAGQGTRFGTGTRKQWLYQGEKPLWQKVLDDFTERFDFGRVIVVGNPDDADYMGLFTHAGVVAGGNSRQESLRHALAQVQTPYVLVNDVARCCLDAAMVTRILAHKDEADCIVPTLPVVDTLYVGDKAVDRQQARRIQTPQLSRTEALRRAIDTGQEFTDESSAIGADGGKVLFVEGSPQAHKLTRPGDLAELPCLIPPSSRTRVGYGIDIHPFEEGKTMKLCGVTIDVPFGFKAHSDGDVAIHALIDAMLGAAGLGDIGELFPDTDAAYAGADSLELLKNVMGRIEELGLRVRNVDMTILAQTPRLLPYKAAMRTTLARELHLPLHRVNIKATTAEKMGFVGREEGVTVHAVASLEYFDWTEVAG